MDGLRGRCRMARGSALDRPPGVRGRSPLAFRQTRPDAELRDQMIANAKALSAIDAGQQLVQLAESLLNGQLKQEKIQAQDCKVLRSTKTKLLECLLKALNQNRRLESFEKAFPSGAQNSTRPDRFQTNLDLRKLQVAEPK